MAKRLSKEEKEIAKFDAEMNAVDRAYQYIDKNLLKCFQCLVEGLDATNDSGNPDWPTRTTCSKVLINKRVPDVLKTTHTGTVNFEPVTFLFPKDK